MTIGKYHVGLRTVKTALAVMCCIIFFDITHRGSPMVATLSAVFALREDLSSTMSFGKSRILGNIVGGASGMLYYLCLQQFPSEIFGQIILVPLFVAVVITISIRMDNDKGIIGGVATFLFICFSIPHIDSYLYAFNRVVDTLIGTCFAIFWNYIIKSPLEDKKESLDDKKDLLVQKENEITKLKEEIKQMEQNA